MSRPALRATLLAAVAICSAAAAALDIPFVQQKGARCGSAAVAMVMEYWAEQIPSLNSAAVEAARIDEYLPVDHRKGIRGERLKEFLESRGFKAFIFDAELSDVQHHLDKGRPLIVCFAPNGPHGPLHYAVIADLDTQSVWLNDSARGKLFREDLGTFVREWKQTGDWALLAVPRVAR